jgi:transcription initiation factor TFIIE subunit beta
MNIKILFILIAYFYCTFCTQLLDKEIVYITRPVDKKKILFYNDKTALMPIDDEFQKLWRSVPVDGIDDIKIEEYLTHQGIRSMQDTSQKVLPSKLKRKAAPKKRTFKKPRDNEHLKEILEEYE